MKKGNTGQRIKLSILHKKPSKLPTSGSPSVARQGHERHHQGIVPPGGENLPEHPQPGGTGNSSCH